MPEQSDGASSRVERAYLSGARTSASSPRAHDREEAAPVSGGIDSNTGACQGLGRCECAVSGPRSGDRIPNRLETDSIRVCFDLKNSRVIDLIRASVGMDLEGVLPS